jgi:UDP-N-acetyl-D-galactosamine dehydrogenase
MHKIIKASGPVAIIGLGYVGLPLLLAASKKFESIGYDIDVDRVSELCAGIDRNGEFSEVEIINSGAEITSNPNALSKCKIFVLTLPTPLGENLQPDISLLEAGIRLLAKYISAGSLVIFESTVYPGCTENFCIPLIEEISKLKASKDFFVAYSPERINPGDKINNFSNINKVVSGIDEKSLDVASSFYGSLIKAEVFNATSVKVAEMAKVLENTQRDVNVALMNEVSMICKKLNISIFDVLLAAQSKWNFLNFTPGLVGGHCIGVDPYYLAYSAVSVKHNPDIILTSRRINENYSEFLLSLVLSEIISRKKNPKNVLLLGGTFKENCRDLRNSKALEFAQRLEDYGLATTILDKNILALPETNKNLKLINNFPVNEKFDVIVTLVKHSELVSHNFNGYSKMLSHGGLIFDFKNFFPHINAENLIKL